MRHFIRGDRVCRIIDGETGTVAYPGNPDLNEVWVIWDKTGGASGHDPSALELLATTAGQLSLEVIEM